MCKPLLFEPCDRHLVVRQYSFQVHMFNQVEILWWTMKKVCTAHLQRTTTNACRINIIWKQNVDPFVQQSTRFSNASAPIDRFKHAA
jgi:hypothetical protein